MDGTIIAYLIKASVSLALFYGLYMLCLRGDTFLRLRRIFFMSAIAFSLLFPLVSIEIPVAENAETAVQLPTYWLSEINVYSVYTPALDSVDEQSVSIWLVILSVAGGITLLSVFRLIIQLISVLRLRLDNKVHQIANFHVIKIEKKEVSPFSFFNWIFINADNQNDHEIDEILLHEYEHVRQYHSIDIIISEILCVFFWWNPFAWMLRREIKVNLEYLADQGVLNAGVNTQEYQYALLRVSCKDKGLSFVNNFNVSQLKKRIAMMNRKKSSFFVALKYLLMVPVGLLLILGNAVQANTSLIDIPSGVLASTLGASEINPLLQKQENAEEQTEDLNIKYLYRRAPSGGKELEKIIYTPADKKNKAFERVEVMPRFAGGESVMQEFIKENLKYPVAAMEKNISGRVTVRFVVDKDGAINDVKIARGFDPECDAEAVRVIKRMPKWEPGKQNGENVPVYFTLPIYFRMSK